MATTTKTTQLTEAERAQRQQIVDETRTSTALEGGRASDLTPPHRTSESAASSRSRRWQPSFGMLIRPPLITEEAWPPTTGPERPAPPLQVTGSATSTPTQGRSVPWLPSRCVGPSRYTSSRITAP